MRKRKRQKFKTRSAASYKRSINSLEHRQEKREPLIVLSFRDFDRNQGQNFEDWEREKLLSLAISKLSAICQHTVAQALANKIIKQYTKVDFPPDSAFFHPKQVPQDVIWCSMHIQGKQCVIGFFEDNVFQIVFLDKNHEFWQSGKKNT